VNRIISKVFAWIMAYQTLPTAAEQVESVVAGFEGMVEKLDAAIDQAADEIGARYDRQDAAWAAFEATREREWSVRDAATAAEVKATTVRNNLNRLLGVTA
jgi:hypothetical protein